MGDRRIVDLVVNADDLGISKEVNEATFRFMAQGRVTSATVLANGPALADAIPSIRHFPNCSFGAHLNVIEFEPLSREAAPFLTKGGVMSRRLVESSAHRLKFMRAVYREFCAQIEKLLACGVPIGHLDSHQHVHTIPWLFPVVKALQARYKIRAIRSSRNIYARHENAPASLLNKKVFFNYALKHVYRSRVTGGMTDMEAVLQLSAEAAQRFRSIEVMVHPGALGQTDDRLLETEWMKDLTFAARLISYQQLEL